VCGTCGCDGEEGDRRLAPLPVPILKLNDAAALRMREELARRGILALNITGTPGAGKTELLRATLEATRLRCGVITADLATDNDAVRLRTTGAPILALETGTACHVPAPLLEKTFARMPLDDLDVLFIENVGNLVCPGLFDIGEAATVLVMSVTEGEDKPEKYPVLFARASLVIVNKIDLLPYVTFDLARATQLARQMRADVEVMPTSAKTGEGLEPWLLWIERRRAAAKRSASLATAV
jgi:hydrogenase nickel incorporation protein HypB